MSKRGNFGDELLNHLEADLGVRHLTTAEFQGDFDLHIFAQEINGMPNLDAQIVRIDFGAQLDFLHLGGVLMLLGFLVALGLFVAELAEIHNPANRRRGVGSDFHQVHPMGAGQIQCVAQRQNPKLFLAILPNNPDFTGTDFPIDPEKRTGRRGVT